MVYSWFEAYWQVKFLQFITGFSKPPSVHSSIIISVYYSTVLKPEDLEDSDQIEISNDQLSVSVGVDTGMVQVCAINMWTVNALAHYYWNCKKAVVVHTHTHCNFISQLPQLFPQLCVWATISQQLFYKVFAVSVEGCKGPKWK